MKAGRVRTVVYPAIFLIAFGIFVMGVVQSGALKHPPEAGDAFDYDAIAFNVWQGRGFGYDWDDAAFRQPYEGDRRYQLLLMRHSSYYPTTYRPPAMPYLLSIVYAVTNRNFAAWRLVNCGIMAGAVTVAGIISAQFAGVPAAVLTMVIAVLNPELTRYAGMFMTEPLAAFLVALLAWTWLRNAGDGWTIAGAARSGIVLGALIATRTIFVLWTPIVLVLPGRDVSFGSKFAWRTKAICLVVAFLVISPWWVRNIVVTKAFMPLGTQGGINLPMGFGPRALRFQGMWASNPGDGFPEIAAQKLDVVTSEVLLAKYRSRLAINWMREHPAEVLHLMRLHVWQEMKPRRDFLSKWLLAAAGLAALFFWKSPGAWVIVLMVSANILSIAMTYSAGGRFVVPLEPLLAALVAAMVVAVMRQAVTSLRRSLIADVRT
jgi:hypothetical protein